jgi:chitodextrinase
MSITSSSIDLAWSAADDNIGVTDYKIYKSGDGVTYDAGTSVGNVTSYTYPGLSAGSQYWFKHTALDAEGNESSFSNVVTATTLGGFDYTLNTVI